MANHNRHGGMDITEQKRTFRGFLSATTYLVAVCLGVLVFLALVNS